MTDLIIVSAIAVASPLGILQLVSEADYLVELNWQGAHKEVSNIANLKPTILTTAADELSQFFNGLRKDFSVPIKLKGTDFQLSVWSELQSIKWGTTAPTARSAILGTPMGSRAAEERCKPSRHHPLPPDRPPVHSPAFQVASGTKDTIGIRGMSSG